jgi:CubicO group peptidase (beta-lactamase class C family)
MDAYIRACTEGGLFSGAVLVARDGRVILSRGYGLASRELGVPFTPQTRLDIGSVSKPFIATLILMLRDRGRLALDDPATKYLPEAPPAWRGVTVRHLLGHTSGIPDYTQLPDYFERRALAAFMADALQRIRAMPLQFEPGSRFQYSSTGYKVLVRIAEKAGAAPFPALLHQLVLRPLGMRDTGVLDAPGIRHPLIERLAAGYTDGRGPVEAAPWVDPTAGGGMYSTVEDLYRFARALDSGRLLSRESAEEASSPGPGRYGMGWFVISGKRDFLLHGGATPGFAVTFARYPAEHATVVVASNLDTAITGPMQDALAAMLFGERYATPRVWKPVAVDPAVYRALVGRYRNAGQPEFFITISQEDQRLWIRLGDDPGATTMVLRPLSPSRYFNRTFLLFEIAFERDSSGRVVRAVTDGPWQNKTFERVP